MKKLFYVLFSATFVLSACKKDKGEGVDAAPTFVQELSFAPFFGDTEVTSMNQVVVLENGWKVKVTQLKFLFTDVEIGGNKMTDAVYYDFPNDYNNVFLKKDSSVNNGPGIKLNLGVGTKYNHSDPSALPVDHPLNILNSSDMHWSWNPGYIFYKMELLVDTAGVVGQDNFNQNLSYHIGLDPNFEVLSIPSAVQKTISNATQRIRLKFDLKELLFSPNTDIDVISESISHSTGPQSTIAERLARRLPGTIFAY